MTGRGEERQGMGFNNIEVRLCEARFGAIRRGKTRRGKARSLIILTARRG